jgi:adenylylsulfate kinase
VFTGISDPYEPPLRPEVTLHTEGTKARDSAREVIAYLEGRGLLA